ncbi:phosphatidylinositol-4-phosphate 5-kinase-domain-containing protein [Obelidium mucronatum]|nr:phosphatidylinositol-4-phosphate 5-kinase-domain-containing protein [Obelidium mucronatum]
MLANEKRALLKDQLEVDLDLLKRHGFMDYSLLVGIHKKPKIRKRKSKWRKFMASRPLSSLANLLVSFKSKAERSTPEPLPTADFKQPQVSVREEILTNSEGTERESAHDNIEASLQPADSWMGTVGNKMMSQLFAGSASRLGSDITDVSGSMKSSRSQLQLRSNENISNEAIAIDLTSILNIADDEENWNSEGAGRLDACRSSPAESRSTSPRYMTEEEEDESDEDCKEFDDKLPFSKQFLGGIRSEGLVSDSVEYEVYFVGLIDILQKFNFAKWVERGIQRKKHGTLRHTTSSVSPQSSLNSSGSGSTVPSSNAPSCPSILEEHASTSTSSSSSFQSICNLVNSESISPWKNLDDMQRDCCDLLMGYLLELLSVCFLLRFVYIIGSKYDISEFLLLKYHGYLVT